MVHGFGHPSTRAIDACYLLAAVAAVGAALNDVVLDKDAGVVQVDQDGFALKKAQRLEFPARNMHGHELVRGQPEVQLDVCPKIDDALDATDGPLRFGQDRRLGGCPLDADVVRANHGSHLDTVGNVVRNNKRCGREAERAPFAPPPFKTLADPTKDATKDVAGDV
jgi:hypothetical protein